METAKKPTEKEVRKELDDILNNAKESKDIRDVPSLIDDYIEQGYKVGDYIPKYNSLAQKLINKG
jgi:predicted metal-dependent enzyme (double-stranded beta helix superfamily)